MTQDDGIRFDSAVDRAHDARASGPSFKDEHATLVRPGEATGRAIEVQADLGFDHLDIPGTLADPGGPLTRAMAGAIRKTKP